MASDNEYMREYMARRYERRKAWALALLGGHCMRCGATDDLDFDHIDPSTKEFTIGSRLAGVAESRLISELSKCQLLCNPCHIVKTREDDLRPWKHGTEYGWTKHRCRCTPCQEAHATYSRRRNTQRRKSDGRGPYGQPADCGTRRSYVRGCRCDACRAANAQASRQRYASSRMKNQAPYA